MEPEPDLHTGSGSDQKVPVPTPTGSGSATLPTRERCVLGRSYVQQCGNSTTVRTARQLHIPRQVTRSGSGT